MTFSRIAVYLREADFTQIGVEFFSRVAILSDAEAGKDRQSRQYENGATV